MKKWALFITPEKRKSPPSISKQNGVDSIELNFEFEFSIFFTRVAISFLSLSPGRKLNGPFEFQILHWAGISL